ncbi:MAG: class I SAM-dependent methyltransferase, partial [Gammaproteobacteria bacterium]
MNTVHTPSYEMRIAAVGVSRQATERELLEDAIALDGKSIIELGCGRAELTRHVAQGVDRRVLALEVDEIQHAHNAARTDLPNVEFRLAGAEAIPAADASFDVALMFKSLHHVPVPEMGNALREIGRVLRPGGLLFVSEPVFAGAFNEILRLFHDEQRVRTAAFDALR